MIYGNCILKQTKVGFKTLERQSQLCIYEKKLYFCNRIYLFYSNDGFLLISSELISVNFTSIWKPLVIKNTCFLVVYELCDGDLRMTCSLT